MTLPRSWKEEGWVEYDGSGLPVHYNDWIDQILYRSGDIAEAGRAGALDWEHSSMFPTVDIVAYLPSK